MNTTKTRTHNCHADSNLQLVSACDNGTEIVASYRCRSCDSTWTEREPQARLLADSVREWREKTAPAAPRCRDCGAPLAEGEKDICDDCLFIRAAGGRS